MANAVSVYGVAKRFRLSSEKHTSLKEKVIRFGRSEYTDFWALQDIDLEIAQGTTVGLLGHNGSGKSTLLKCIAGILQPTTGEIRTVGRMAALLELGAGMNPELTGRENIFLNGAILGFTKRDLERRFDDIVGFAELEQFIDTQVKYYSSGMYVRLGFAVAVNVDPDVLLVDEVLAVGDEAFQQKCLDRVKQFQVEGRTIVVVTHAADLVRKVCDGAAVLDHGHLVYKGSPGEAVRSFREHLLTKESYDHDDDQLPEHRVTVNVKPIEITYVTVERDVLDRTYLVPFEKLRVRVGYEAFETIPDATFGIVVYDREGNLVYSTSSALLGASTGPFTGTGEVMFTFESVPLLDGSYPLSVGISSSDWGVVYDWREQCCQFEVMNPTSAQGSVALPMSVTIAESSATPDKAVG
jgi:ABC-2 type transport system ATP-binding protein